MPWGSSLFIIFIFVMLAFYIATSVGVKNIQENWPEYRCNPLYMPFASTLAPVPTTARENFSYCLSDYMKSAGPALTQPISYVQSATLALMGTMTESNEKSAEQQSDFSHSVNDLFNSNGGVGNVHASCRPPAAVTLQDAPVALKFGGQQWAALDVGQHPFGKVFG